MSDKSEVEELIQTYFDCMFESSSAKAHQAFHPNARITGYMQGKLSEADVPAFADLVGSQSPSAKDKGEKPVLEIQSLDIAGDTAVARVRDAYLGLIFMDTLSCIKVDGQWQIYNKLFHVEGRG